ncbi:MAG: hypothetical protein H5T84_04055, partial [Thermoleophilia bacterium]|nr:hypothetical protein [Thermoleophilia bacterium]
MAFPKDVFPADDHCEICGVPLGDEVVIQEFADGSTARLCPECAAGAALEETSLEHSGDMLGHNVKAGDVSADSRSVDNGAAHDVTPSSEAADIWAADHGTAVHGAADRGTVDNEAVFPPWEGEEVLPPH